MIKQTLQKWNEAQSFAVTWKKIIQVLESLKLRKTADNVKQFLKKPRNIAKLMILNPLFFQMIVIFKSH